MTFIVILIALLIERFFDWSHLRLWQWYAAYQRLVMQRFPSLSPYLSLALTIIPLLLLVALVEFLLKGWLYGFIRLLFQLFILIYCLGPQSLWADAFSCMNALVHGDAHFAADKLKALFGITDLSASQQVHKQLLNNFFMEANRRVFAVVFWYVLLGPVGALLYRMISLSAQDTFQKDAVPELLHRARFVEALLDWVPIRLLTLIFALGGHFVQVLSSWRRNSVLSLKNSDILLTECGTAALGSEGHGKVPEDGSAESAAISLLDRSFVIVLVIVAVIVVVT